MSESKHTPGPWLVQMEWQGEPVVALVANPGRSVYVVSEDGPPRNGEANARLIAAAPELLEALKALQKVGVLNPTNSPRVNQAISDMVAAIKKAEGHQ